MAKFNLDTDNQMFQLAVELVHHTSRNIFLTGKAGTGKTTFLKYIRENCSKQMAILAPTGVAAINAGGVTIHSFFQLPLAPFIPESRGTGFNTADQEISNKHSLLSHLRFNTDKKKLLQQLEILVIDEISMVRCDTLDAIDTVLRHIRHQPNEPFGGVQLLFIGDMLQLPPVIKEQEWNLLSKYYNSPYFFDSRVLQQQLPVYIEFDKIYRQTDERFINLLNQVRNNELDQEGMTILESRFQSTFQRSNNDGYIILTTHNNKAGEINSAELGKIPNKLFSYHAEKQDDFSDRAYPADEILQLKVGAQVMFIRNDTAEKGKRYFNGKIGTVSKLEENKIFVQCEGAAEIEVQKEKWENIRYSLNKKTRQLEADVLGSFTQYPLRLAWAITIHKSQGLTFEKAIIDAGAAFAPGQVYVALSRCTNLEGIVLQSHIKRSALSNDPRIVEFSQRSASGDQLKTELSIAAKHYRQTVLLMLFDFAAVTNIAKELQEYLLEHKSSFNEGTVAWIEKLLDQLTNTRETAVKFKVQLKQLFEQTPSAKGDQVAQERIAAAAKYFCNEIGSLLSFMQQSPAITDSRVYAKEYSDSLREIMDQLAMKKFLLEGIDDAFDMKAFHVRKQKFASPGITVNAYAGTAQQRTETNHPELYRQLRTLRDTICAETNLPVYMVAGSNTLNEMTRYLPQSLTELRKITGFGDAKIKKYGQEFLDILLAYCSENGLNSLMDTKTPKRERKERTGPAKKKGDTYAESFKLYKEGQSITGIALARGLTMGTIETHLSRFVESGEIQMNELVSSDKIELIQSALTGFNGNSIVPIKEQLGESISYGEIRLVMAGLGISLVRSADE